MQAFLRWLLSCAIRLFLKPILSRWVPIRMQRAWVAAILVSSRPPRNTRFETIEMNGVKALRVSPATPGSRVMLYLHSGGYCIGAHHTHRGIAGHIARAADAVAYVLDYRLAPEHPHPAALEDSLAAYRWLLAQGTNPSLVFVAGDSAGGGLTLATAVAIREAGLPLPAALVLMSAWADLSLSGESMTTHARRDPMLSRAVTARWSRLYRGPYPADHPPCSPLFADLSGLPPMLIQTGSEEVLLSDSLRIAKRAQAARIHVQLRVYEKMWHDFQLHAGLLQEADDAVAEIGEFVKNTIAVS